MHTLPTRARGTAALVFLFALAACSQGGTQKEPDVAMLKATGLYLTDNPLDAPPGSLSRADDAVIRRTNVLEPRRGNAPDVSLASPARALTTYGGSVIANTNASTLVRRTSSSSYSEYFGSFTPPLGQERMHFAESKGNLYFTTSTGVDRLDSLTGTPALTGEPKGLEGTYSLTGTSGFLPSASAVAYRFVWGRRDANGNLLLGAPSGRLVASCILYASGTVTLTGGAGNVTVTVGGTAVGPVAFNTSDAQTALDVITALNANPTVAALVTATSGGSGVITITADASGPAGDAITLTASRTAGAATASGATLTGGSSSRDVVLTPRIPSGVTAGVDFLQVYRTETRATADGDPGEEMAQVAELFPTAADVTAGTISYTDVASVTNGPTAYFAPSQGGIINSKDRPPIAKDVAFYKGYAFYAVKSARQQAQLTLLSVGGSQGLQSGNGIRLVFSDDEVHLFTAGGTETTNPAALPATFKLYTSGSAAQNIEDTARSLVRVINLISYGRVYAEYASGANDPPGIIILSARALEEDPFAIQSYGGSQNPWAPALQFYWPVSLQRIANVTYATSLLQTHGLAVGQEVTLGSATTGFTDGTYTVASIVDPNTISFADPGADTTGTGVITTNVDLLTSSDSVQANTWALSAFEEPEAVPPGNYFTVGGAQSTLYRIVANGDALWFFTSEGLYRLSGDSEDNFAIRPFDLTVKLLAPDSVTVLDNRLFALAEKGVVAISDTGVEVVSHLPGRTSIQKPLQELVAAFKEAGASQTLANLTHAVGYETEHEYRLWLPATTADTTATFAWVFNVQQGAWTKHNVPARCAVIMPGEDRQYLGLTTAALARERKALAAADFQDAAGVGIPFSVAYTVLSGEDPGMLKHWQMVEWLMESPAPTSLGVSLSTEVATTPTTGSLTTDGLTYTRSYVPEDMAYSSTLTVGASHSVAAEKCSILGIAVTFATASNALSTR